MKRIAALLISFLLSLSFVSCKKLSYESNVAASTSLSSTAITYKVITDLTVLTSEYIQKTSVASTAKETFAKITENTSEISESSSESETSTEQKKYCTIKISCNNILGNEEKLKNGKEEFLPQNGIILDTTMVEINGNETVYDVLLKVCTENICTDGCEYCRKNGIHIESEYTPGFDNYYIEGIHQVYEKDCGSKSGWMYSVNGIYPNVGCSAYTVNDGDAIEWSYTLDLGDDLGAEL